MNCPPRAVIDTNVVVSAFVFRAGPLAWLREALVAARFVPLVSTATLAELVRVLSYERLKLTGEERGIILTSYMEHAQTLVNPGPRPKIPECRDADDEVFLRLAYAAKAHALLTGDRALLVLADVSRIPILTPAQFGEKFT